MKKLLTLLTALVIVFTLTLSAEEDVKVHVSAYVDTYIATDNDKSSSEDSYRGYSCINGQKDAFGINIAQISGNMEYGDDVHGFVTLHWGDFPVNGFGDNGIQEAYVGVRVCENVWIDAGFFLTHIGGESVLPKDNWLSTHSMITYIEPFFHTGVKALYDDGTFKAGLHILNTAFSMYENNDNKTIGYNLGYCAGDIFYVSLAGMMGNEVDRGQEGKVTMYNNICIGSNPTEELGLKAQVDIASCEDGYMNSDNELEDASYMGFSVQGRYQLCEKMATTARFSYFDDTKQFAGILASGMGITVGAEYQPTSFSYIRIEGRMLNFDEGDEDLFGNKPGNKFKDDDGPTNSRMEVNLNFGVYID